MKRRFISALLALCLLLAVLPTAGLAEEKRLSSMEELTSWLYYEGACSLQEEIEFGYTQSLDYLFEGEFPWDMLFSSGMGDMRVSVDHTYREVTIMDIEYYPGFKAAQAWRNGNIGMLNEQERAVFDRANAIVQEASRYAQSPYQVLINLHDALVEQVDFTEGSDDFESHDTAVGALLYGQAECDGYADAFYLLCALAGFDCRMVCGHAGYESKEESGSHMWNLVLTESGWYHVDVSWDDLDFDQNPSMATYRYFLMGSAMMEIHHLDETLLVDQPQPYTDWSYAYYTSDHTGMTYGAYYLTPEDAVNYILYMHLDRDQRMIHVMIDGNYQERTEQLNQMLKEGGMRKRWWTWAKKSGDYTCISICIE